MTQPPPEIGEAAQAAILKCLSTFKLSTFALTERVSVQDKPKQLGTDTTAFVDALPPPRGGEAARTSALGFAASYAGIGQRVAIVGFLANAFYLLYQLASADAK
jgi:hypothetical protein